MKVIQEISNNALRNLASSLILCFPYLVHADIPDCCLPEHCYNPPAHAEGNGWFIAQVDFLLLMAQEEGLEYVVRDRTPVNFARSSDIHIPYPQNGRAKHVEINFQPGFRVKLTDNFSHDDWDIALDWTHYAHSHSSSTSVNPSNDSLFPIKILGGVGGNLATTAKATWKLDFNTLDLGLGRSYWIGNYLAVHPIIGIRSGWIKQHFDITYFHLTNGVNAVNSLRASKYTTKDKNNFWGIGPIGELDLRFAFNCNWSLYGHGAIALLWGFFDVAEKQIATHDVPVAGASFSGIPTVVDLSNSIDTLKANAELNFGLQWDHYFTNSLYHLGFHLGWEYHIWFEQNQSTFVPARFQIIKSLGDLSLSGLVFGANFNF